MQDGDFEAVIINYGSYDNNDELVSTYMTLQGFIAALHPDSILPYARLRSLELDFIPDLRDSQIRLRDFRTFARTLSELQEIKLNVGVRRQAEFTRLQEILDSEGSVCLSKLKGPAIYTGFMAIEAKKLSSH